MAITIVQSKALTIVNGAGQAQFTLTGVKAGNAIVVTASLFAGGRTNDLFKATDTTTSTALTAFQEYTPGGNYGSAFVAWELAVVAGSHAILVEPVTADSSCFYTVMVHEVSGLGTTQPSVTTGTTTTGTTLTLAGGTPTQNGCIVFTAISVDGNTSGSTGAATTPSGYTSLWSEMAGASNNMGAAAYEVQSAAAPVTPSWTGLNAGGGAGWAGVAVAFAPVGGGTTIAASQSEAASAAAAQSATPSTAASVAEAGTALAVSSVLVTTSAMQSDAAAAADSSATGESVTVAEAASAVDASAQTAQTTAAQIETASAIDATGLGGGSSIVLAYASKADPNQASTTSPLITAGITTPATGSTIIVNLLTESTSTAPVTNFSDSYGNVWTLVATNYYAGGTAANGSFPSYLLKCVNAKGGANHTFQLAKNSVQDECTIYAVVLNGGDIGNWTCDTTGTYSGTVTTSKARSSVLSFWSPNDTGSAGYTDNYHAPSEWVQMANNNNAYNSMSGADAYLSPVAASGTAVTATWTADNTGGGINPGQCMYMVEVTAPPGVTDSATSTESASASETPTSSQQSTAAQSDTGAAADSATKTAATTAAQPEPADAVDLTSNAAGSTAAQAESATAADAASNIAGTTVAQAESAAAADAPSLTSSTVTATAETSAATDAAVSSGVALGNQSDGAAAADSASTGNVSISSVAEPGAAADFAASVILSISQIAESAMAAAVAASQSSTTAQAHETGTGTDAQSAAQSGVQSMVEQGSAADRPASAEQITASGTEAASAADQPTAGNVLPANATAAGSASDSLGASIALLSAAQEIAVATDALTYAASTISDAAEAAQARDLVATLAQLSQQITEAANAQDVAILIQTLAEIAEWQYLATQAARIWAVFMPGRIFYAGAPFRSFYVLVNSNMAQMFPSAIDPRETKVLTLDATSDLPGGVTLTGTPTVSIAVVRGTDADAPSRFSDPQINTAPITITKASGVTITIAPGLAVQIIASGCLDGCWYEMAITCSTTQANNVETLKAVLQCTAS